MGTAGLIFQTLLGFLSFLALLCTELTSQTPSRKTLKSFKNLVFGKIITQDVSKQGVSATLAHILNVMLALFLSSSSDNDPCSQYLFNLIRDILLPCLWTLPWECLSPIAF